MVGAKDKVPVTHTAEIDCAAVPYNHYPHSPLALCRPQNEGTTYYSCHKKIALILLKVCVMGLSLSRYF